MLFTFLTITSFSCEFQEWPEEDYPTYANGPGYIVSSNIAQLIVSDFEEHKLRVCGFVLLFNLCVCVCLLACSPAHTCNVLQQF